jgi:hypothetical protein
MIRNRRLAFALTVLVRQLKVVADEVSLTRR